jgi:hypothetical protein
MMNLTIQKAYMLLQKLGQSAALKLYKLQSQSPHRQETVDIIAQIKRTAKVLICLPTEKEGFDAALVRLDDFRRIFPSCQLTLLFAQQNSLPAEISNSLRAVCYDQNKLNAFGSINKDLKNELEANRFDMIIDLEREFKFITTSIAWNSQALLRVCFSHPQRDDFYNFIVRLDPDQSWQNAFKLLLGYLNSTCTA